MNRFSKLIAAALVAFTPTVSDAKTVHTIGDSTMANYDEEKTDTRGWCQYLQQFFEGLTVNNRGKNGASSKSFYKESAYWASVKKQLKPGDYVIIQFSHNDEKTGGVDGDELKAYYTAQGDATKAAAVDYRGTCPSTTYKEYLRKYINETREAGCTPILVAPVCRMYFSGNTIRRNGRHDLGDKFDVLTASGLKTGQKVSADDHSMDYPYQMKQVAEEMNVPFVDMTTATAELFLEYGDAQCHAVLGDGQGSTHLSATGAALIARRFASLCRQQNLFTEYIKLDSELSLSPTDGNLGKGYQGQELQREFMLTGYDLTPADGTVTITADGTSVTVSSDKTQWQKSLLLNYKGGTVIDRFYVRLSLDKPGENNGSVNVSIGDKSISIPVTGTAIELAGGSEVSVYWRLESDDSYVAEGPVNVIAENWSGMHVQRYQNPNANTVWPAETGFDASRKTQRNLIDGDAWPAGEIDEVSTRYIEFGVTAAPETELNIDEISYYVCGCGGNGMCLNVWYSVNDDFSEAVQLLHREKMPANNMIDGRVTPVVKLAEGQSLRLRFYPWYNGAATGKTLCISDVRFHGIATSLSGIGSIASDLTAVSETYYNLQGVRVDNPVEGQLYIRSTVKADGSVSNAKILY